MKQGTTPKVGAALQVCLHHAARLPPLWERCPRAGSYGSGTCMRVGRRTDAKTNQSALTLAQRRGIEGSSLGLPGVLASPARQDPLRKAEAKSDSDWESQR